MTHRHKYQNYTLIYLYPNKNPTESEHLFTAWEKFVSKVTIFQIFFKNVFNHVYLNTLHLHVMLFSHIFKVLITIQSNNFILWFQQRLKYLSSLLCQHMDYVSPTQIVQLLYI